MEQNGYRLVMRARDVLKSYNKLRDSLYGIVVGLAFPDGTITFLTSISGNPAALMIFHI